MSQTNNMKDPQTKIKVNQRPEFVPPSQTPPCHPNVGTETAVPSVNVHDRRAKADSEDVNSKIAEKFVRPYTHTPPYGALSTGKRLNYHMRKIHLIHDTEKKRTGRLIQATS